MSVPQYDPVVIYAPQTIVTQPAPVTTTTTTTTTKEDDDGHSTSSMVATGLLSFGAGLLVADLFDDNDHYGNMWHGPMPYYPPYPYRPAYGGGYYPGNAYNRPNNYVRGGNTININSNNDYNNRYGSEDRARQNRNSPKSPISSAKPGRTDLNQLNAKAKNGPQRRAKSSGSTTLEKYRAPTQGRSPVQHRQAPTVQPLQHVHQPA
ncbi:MAG: hypothetical protein ABI616_03155 [Pseudomonadota bacterium]